MKAINRTSHRNVSACYGRAYGGQFSRTRSYDLILQPSAFLDAHTFIGNTAVMQIDKIRELIGGKIYVTPALKAADGGTDALLMEQERRTRASRALSVA